MKVGKRTMLKQNMYTIEEGEPSVFERETKKSALALQAVKQKLLYGQPRAGRDDDHQACALAFAMAFARTSSTEAGSVPHNSKSTRVGRRRDTRHPRVYPRGDICPFSRHVPQDPELCWHFVFC